MLNEKQLLAAQLIFEGRLKKTEIAEQLKIARNTIYYWLEDEEFKAELDRLRQRIKLEGDQALTANLNLSIDNIIRLARFAKSEKVKLEANVYLVDRVLGKTTTKLDVTTEEKIKNIEGDVIEAEFREWEEESKTDDE